MRYVRSVDDRDAFDTGYPGHRAQYLSQLESALVFASSVAEGGRAAGLHYHPADQLYFLFEGSMTVQYGDDQRRIESGTLVHIPAGIAHANWNDGPGPETHLEVVVPALRPGQPLAFHVETPGDVPEDVRTTQRVTITSVNGGALADVKPGSGVRVQALAGPGTAIDTVIAYYVELDAGCGDDTAQVGEHDTYLFVISGSLTVEIAGELSDVGARSVVLLPAGVSHRYTNRSDAPVMSLAILAPALGETWDRDAVWSKVALRS
jgi:mannose-6-phosphate isomerase-like protein (cupin superfamily)